MSGRKTGRETMTPRIEKMFTLVTYSHPGILCPHTKHNRIWYKTDDELGDDEEQNHKINSFFFDGFLNHNTTRKVKFLWKLEEGRGVQDLGKIPTISRFFVAYVPEVEFRFGIPDDLVWTCSICFSIISICARIFSVSARCDLGSIICRRLSSTAFSCDSDTAGIGD